MCLPDTPLRWMMWCFSLCRFSDSRLLKDNEKKLSTLNQNLHISVADPDPGIRIVLSDPDLDPNFFPLIRIYSLLGGLTFKMN